MYNLTPRILVGKMNHFRINLHLNDVYKKGKKSYFFLKIMHKTPTRLNIPLLRHCVIAKKSIGKNKTYQKQPRIRYFFLRNIKCLSLCCFWSSSADHDL